MQLVYPTDIFEDNYNIVRFLTWLSYQKTMQIDTENNNTQKVCEQYWFLISFRET